MVHAHGFDVWQEPYVPRRLPMLFNLRMDPLERAKESGDYPHRRADRGIDGRIRHVG
jgi:hypothetical protein